MSRNFSLVRFCKAFSLPLVATIYLSGARLIRGYSDFSGSFFSHQSKQAQNPFHAFNRQSVRPPPLPFTPLLVSVEGNIGAGKSTLIKAMRQRQPTWQIIDEPLDFWQKLRNENGQSLLEVFYADQRRWSYTFQNCALLSRFENIENTIANHAKTLSELNGKLSIDESARQATSFAASSSLTTSSSSSSTSSSTTSTAMSSSSSSSSSDSNNLFPPPVIFLTERCLDTDHQVFARMLHSQGQLDALEFELYQRWFNMLQKAATPLSAIVYVDTVPTECSRRIEMRGREGEGKIPLSYLEALDGFQHDWIDNTHLPVVCVQSSEIDKVEQFLKNHARLCSETLSKSLSPSSSYSFMSYSSTSSSNEYNDFGR